MKLGLHIASTTWRGGPGRLGPTMAEIVQVAEAAGFDTIDVADHLWQHPIMGGPEAPQIEAYTMLGFIAAHTRRVRLMALATAVSYRPAGLLAKMVTTLDVLSGGWAMLAMGAGDYPEEATGLGLPFHRLVSGPTSSRMWCRPACGCGGVSRATSSRSMAATSGSSGR